MRKFIFVIITLLCAITASAVEYASPYRGAGIGGYTHQPSSARMSSYGSSSSGYTQISAASMKGEGQGVGISYDYGTKSAYAPNIVSVGTIHTSASVIYGGVTTYDMPSGGRNHAPRKVEKYPPSTDPTYNEWCHYEWVYDPTDEVDGGYWRCTECGHELGDGTGTCTKEHHYVPITDGWQVLLFMIVLAGAYALYKGEGRKVRG